MVPPLLICEASENAQWFRVTVQRLGMQPILVTFCIMMALAMMATIVMLAGYGYESYPACPLEFCGIGNIHVSQPKIHPSRVLNSSEI